MATSRISYPAWLYGCGCCSGIVLGISIFREEDCHDKEGEKVVLIDGGYCANNPTLYAIADAMNALKFERKHIQVVSVGVGEYPEPKKSIFSAMRWVGYAYRLRPS